MFYVIFYFSLALKAESRKSQKLDIFLNFFHLIKKFEIDLDNCCLKKVIHKKVSISATNKSSHTMQQILILLLKLNEMYKFVTNYKHIHIYVCMSANDFVLIVLLSLLLINEIKPMVKE